MTYEPELKNVAEEFRKLVVALEVLRGVVTTSAANEIAGLTRRSPRISHAFMLTWAIQLAMILGGLYVVHLVRSSRDSNEAPPMAISITAQGGTCK